MEIVVFMYTFPYSHNNNFNHGSKLSFRCQRQSKAFSINADSGETTRHGHLYCLPLSNYIFNTILVGQKMEWSTFQHGRVDFVKFGSERINRKHSYADLDLHYLSKIITHLTWTLTLANIQKHSDMSAAEVF